MKRKYCRIVMLLVLSVTIGLVRTAGAAPQGSTNAASIAAQASPELVQNLSSELGSSPEQAAGAAGALFGLAQSRLKPDEFAQVSGAVPGMASLLKAAPAAAGGTSGALGTPAAVTQLAGPAAGLAGVGTSFSKLGLKPEMVTKAVPVLVAAVTKSGGANVGSLLANVLK